MSIGYDDRLRMECVLAGLATSVTVLAGLAVAPVMGLGVLPLFLVAVVVSADFGQRRAGLIATAISIPVAAYVFVPPAWSWGLAPDAIAALAVFAADGVAISFWFGDNTAS